MTVLTQSALNRLLINRNFAWLWGGQTISYLGDWIFSTTLILWIATRIAAGQAWAPLAVSGVLLSSSVATFLVGPLAGVFVDRWDKRRTLLWMDGLRGVLIAMLIPLAFARVSTLPRVWELGLIYSIIMLTTVCDQFFSPARFALVGDIVPEQDRARATGIEQASQQFTAIIGPPLAAPLLFTFGVQWALVVNALSFGASFVAIFAVDAPPSARSVAEGTQGNVAGEFFTGLRFFAGNRVLVTLLIVAVVAMLGAGATNALDYFFIRQDLHAAAGLYGVMGAAAAAGSLVGALLAGALAQRIGLARYFWISILLTGVLFLVYARMTAFVPGVIARVAECVPNAATSVVFAPLVLQVTPRELVGRAFAVLVPGLTLASMLSIVIAGYLDSVVLRGFHARLLGVTLGPVDTIFTVGAVLIILAGVFGMLNLRVPIPRVEPAPTVGAAG
jgi:MFS family permease